ncbi:HPr family phosphocarrier protein [Desulfovibrio sp. TomC]|uniref:HPr family phosphocarrier protein n=1 Tax=Desulfovibrio sp. TomC TaxID=1562888 RepID=UPI0005BDDAF7|nr:HPr family phosphocarrier protein [Desulfovibrio sp. TomC]
MTEPSLIAPTTGADDILADNDGYSLRVRVLNDQGLHARPAARLAQEAQKFTCDVHLRHDEADVDAKSILDILTMAAGHGSELELRAHGPDAVAALRHLGELFRNHFR